MFAAEYFVGSARGGWHRGDQRWPSAEAAQIAVNTQAQRERAADITSLLRRVRAV